MGTNDVHCERSGAREPPPPHALGAVQGGNRAHVQTRNKGARGAHRTLSVSLSAALRSLAAASLGGEDLEAGGAGGSSAGEGSCVCADADMAAAGLQRAWALPPGALRASPHARSRSPSLALRRARARYRHAPVVFGARHAAARSTLAAGGEVQSKQVAARQTQARARALLATRQSQTGSDAACWLARRVSAAPAPRPRASARDGQGARRRTRTRTRTRWSPALACNLRWLRLWLAGALPACAGCGVVTGGCWMEE